MILSNPEVHAAKAQEAPASDPDADRSWALTAVTAIFLLGGLTAALDLVSGGGFRLMGGGRGNLSLNFGFLAFPVGIGLLRRRPGWRTVALVMTVVNVVLALLVAFVWLAGIGEFTMGITGRDTWVPSETWIGFVFLASLAAFFGWMTYVLLRPDTRKRFQDHRPDRPWIEWTALTALVLVAFLF
ncbi:MAG: hypothetical protein EA350_07580 [Gemmatimonadales bacterium]|nr:MAG: hypothetical protein EA350_07580 [Gemmatimonadales bacterium]